MMLRSFEVRGFKNLSQSVRLDGLGSINVIHGPNNVGKSNLLQAMQVSFRMIGEIGPNLILHSAGIELLRITVNGLSRGIGIEPTEVLNLEKPAPISLKSEIEVGREELARIGIDVENAFSWAVKDDARNVHVLVEVELLQDSGDLVIVLKGFDFSGQKFETLFSNAQSKGKQGDLLRLMRNLFAYFSQNLLLRSRAFDRFALVGIDRLSSSRSDLAIELYDAKESAEIEQAKRWERFLEAMDSFKDIMGDGSFVATYDRKASKANLFYQTSFARVPLGLLGSGVQQIVSLVGQLLMTNATIVAIEEPELNMRYTLQERLRDVLKQKIVGAPGGPSQLFITSHSPAFEAGPHFYMMEPTPQGPKVEARKVEQARVAVGFPEDVVPPGIRAARCYLSTEGVVRVPERIRHVLGLPNGGGVMFLENKGHIEMISDERLAALLDETPAGEGNEQP